MVAVLLLAAIVQSSLSRRSSERGLDRLNARLDEHLLRADKLGERFGEIGLEQQKGAHEIRETLSERFSALRESFEQRNAEAQKQIHEGIVVGSDRAQKQVAEHLTRSTEDLVKRMEALTRATDERLKEISGQVDQRLAAGFEKTNETFSQVISRLALIDEAQKKITELSSNVVSLQQVLSDRSSRGAFGEVQLKALVSNVLPQASYALQHTLSNGRRVDCMLFLPEPTGSLAVDSKFPLDNYRRKSDPQAAEDVRKTAERDFARDVQIHIDDVASKYIIEGETAGGAILFIPAEAVFADIHGSYPELVERAHRAHVWMASPTTLMAILTTASAVIKDAETRQQVHIIQEHLRLLAKDFQRFQTRMGDLARHIDMAYRDVEQVHVSAKKIAGRFYKIEKLELGEGEQRELPLPEGTDEPEA